MANLSADLTPITFSEAELQTALRTIAPNKAPGADGIVNALLKNAGPSARKSLLTMSNASLHTGCIPSRFKVAKCIALFKKGAPDDASNYRVIALSSTLLRLMETLVLPRLKQACPPSSLHPLQFGFREKHGTAEAMAYALEKIRAIVAVAKTTAVAFLDFSKAFDTVCHPILLTKIWRRGARGALWRWVSNYLANRKFLISSGALSSRIHPSECGTPQGGILSPYLFLLFIDDIAEVIRPTGCEVILYADDILIIPTARTTHEAYAQLAAALAAASKWAEGNLMQFNTAPGKSAILIISKSSAQKHPLPPDPNTFVLSGVPLSIVKSYKYLGVIWDSTLSFKDYFEACEHRVAAACSAIHKILKPTKAIPPRVIRTLLLGFVYPIFIYGSHITPSPTLKFWKRLRSLVYRVLSHALHCPVKNPHALSLFIEFAIPLPHLARAISLFRFVQKQQTAPTATGALIRDLQSLPHLLPPDSLIRNHNAVLFTVSANAPNASPAEVIAAQRAGLDSAHWGQPLRDSQTICRSDFSRPQPYLSLPSSSAQNVASLRLDWRSFWRDFKQSARPNEFCPFCVSVPPTRGSALHLVLSCPRFASQRAALNCPLSSIVSPPKDAPFDKINAFLLLVYGAIRDN
jgi:hypothetical protein